MTKNSLNGSVDLLADAMRKVFSEAVEGAVEPLRDDVKGMRSDMSAMEGRLNEKIDKGLQTTNENVQSQLAQNRQEISEDVKTALADH